MIAPTTTPNRRTRPLGAPLLVLQALAGGAVPLAHASERLSAPACSWCSRCSSFQPLSRSLFTRDIRNLVLISWGSGALASLLGLWLSYVADLPTGPLIVCMYGLVLAVAGLLRKLGVGGVADITAPAGTPS